MKSAAIKRLLAQDPRTVFGLRMTTTADRLAGVPVFVRGLSATSRPGEWFADYVKRGVDGHWRRVEAKLAISTISSRDLIAETAAIEAAKAIELARDEATSDRLRAERLAMRLDALGVQARANNASVTVEDVLALDMLLTELKAP